MSEMNEWDLRGGNTILTGSSDGVVRMWSLQFVQVPDESAKQKTSSAAATAAEKDTGKEENEKEKRAEDEHNLNSIQNRFKGENSDTFIFHSHLLCGRLLATYKRL